MDLYAAIEGQRASLDEILPGPHRTGARRLVEVIEGCGVLTHDRKRSDWSRAYASSCTPVQLLRILPGGEPLSVLTPSRLTGGKFEIAHAGRTRRFCCYCCARRKLWDELDVLLPSPSGWMVYMLVESVGYMECPDAPHERSYGQKG